MAEIFLATQLGREGFQKPVILKRIHSTIYADPQFRNMFIDEAHISMGLSHSNIVQVLDLGVGSGRYFLVHGARRRVGPRARAPSRGDGRRAVAARARPATSRPRCAARSPTRTARSRRQSPLGIVHRDVSPHNISPQRAGRGEAHRLRHRQGDGQARADRHGRGQGQGRLHVARAGAGQGDRRALRSVRRRRRALSAGHRRAPVRGADRSGDAVARAEGRTFARRSRRRPICRPQVAAIIARAMQHGTRRALPERRRDARATSSACCARCFAPSGQTELKRWLAELGARDGVLPMASDGAHTPPHGPSPGTGEMEGKDVAARPDEDVDGEEATSLAGVKGGGAHALTRLARRAPTGPRCRCPKSGTSPTLSGRMHALGAAAPRRRGAARAPARAAGRRLLDPDHRGPAGRRRLVRRQVPRALARGGEALAGAETAAPSGAANNPAHAQADGRHASRG